MTAQDVIKNALMEIGAYAQGEDMSGEDASYGLSKLNRLLDQMNADSLMIYSIGFKDFVLTPNHQPHTIGVAANNPNFAVTGARPVRIDAANIILNNVNPNVNSPLNIRGDDWWGNQRIRGLTSGLPTDLYYSPDWPNGSVYLWPVPTIAYGLDLEIWTLLSGLALDDPFSLPPGYEDAITYTLAESLCPGFQRPLDPVLVSLAQKARTQIKRVNSQPQQMSTADSGLPSSSGGGYFNYRTGRIV